MNNLEKYFKNNPTYNKKNKMFKNKFIQGGKRLVY